MAGTSTPFFLYPTGSPPVVVNGGVRSLFAFWMGGAAAGAGRLAVGRPRRITRREFEESLKRQRDNTFSRRRFEELWAASEAAAKRAERPKVKKAAPALEEASLELVSSVAGLGLLSEVENKPQIEIWISEATRLLNNAAKVRALVEAENYAKQAKAYARKIAHEIEMQQDEEEAILLLMS